MVQLRSGAVAMLALLAWGCQEQASSPTGPDSGTTVPNFNHNDKAPLVHGGGDGDETDDGTFTVSFGAVADGDAVIIGGDVGGDAVGILQGPHGGKNVLQEEFGFPVTITSMDFPASVVGADMCFRAGTPNIPSESGMQVGQVKPSNIEDAIINFFFRALGTAGEPDVDYVLKVFGTFDDPGHWPPANENDTDTITGTRFVLAHVNGPGRKAACTGEGNLGEDDFVLTVTRN